MGRSARQPGVSPVAILVGWTAVGVFGLGNRWLYSLSAHEPLPTRGELAASFFSVWLWAAFTPGILLLVGRLPLEGGAKGMRRSLGWHLLANFALALIDPLCDTALAPWLPQLGIGSWPVRFAEGLFVNVFSYLTVAVLGYALVYQRQLADRRLATAELEGQLWRAHLDALQMQLRPHFLFNALNTVSSLVRAGKTAPAVATLAGLGDLLRAVLDGGSQLCPLAEELALVRRYLAIEAIRFADRLQVSIDVAPGAEGVLVPRLLLQPLVENAIRHGVETAAGPARVAIDVRREGGRLWVRVRDRGGEEAAAGPEGIGLGNTRARLRHLYGDRFLLEVARAGGETVALVAVPEGEGADGG